MTFKNTVAIAVISFLSVASFALTSAQQTGKTYVLVHGSWMGKFAWDEIKPRLEKAGNMVITLDLPGHGDDPTTTDKLSLEGYKQAVIAAIGTRKEVILVGHSFGGVVISSVAEEIPAQLSKLVFVAGYLPRNGESAYSLSGEDKGSKVGSYWTQADPQNYSPASIKPEGIVEVFCADCPDKYKQLLVAKHRPEAVTPIGTPVALTEKNYSSVPRYYVETLKDNTISHDLQTLMLSRVSVAKRYQLNASHSPFFSQPDKLARILLGL
jgi:pimeloyl-ACP methyl ester carboxylesterase